MDASVAVVSMLVLAPLFSAIALALVAERRGSVFYTQERLGLGGRPFRIIKFRSMVADAERETGPVWASRGDPRATRVGRLLRATHLDELPQLLNVLRGEMSLVGPRPERPAIAARLEQALPGYRRRTAVPPGMTGLAQVRCGYDSSTRTVRRKLRYDSLYIRSRSLWLDLSILARTPAVVARDARGALPAPARGVRAGSRRIAEASAATELSWIDSNAS